MSLVSDNASEPTSVAFMKDTGKPGIHQIFCANDNPQGNAETGRVIRTIKEECLWLNDFGSLEEAGTTISAWIGEDYNRLYSTRPWAIGTRKSSVSYGFNPKKLFGGLGHGPSRDRRL